MEKKIEFKTHYTDHDDDGEYFEPDTSLVQPGRSESIEHLVQRLTRKPDPTARDVMNMITPFEQADQLSDQDVEDRLSNAETLADKIDLQEATLEAEAELYAAQANAKEQSVANATTNEPTAATAQAPNAEGN